MEHTPGPWEADNGIVFSDFGTIATVIIDMVDKEANANLIAAAPDLLESLETLYDLFKSGDYPGTEDLDNAHAAIAKAEGKAPTVNDESKAPAI